MIPRAYITEWRSLVQWSTNAQVEQDLVISRALVELFASPLIAKTLAFRGDTALHKLYLSPQPRYSEDIDLVQIKPPTQKQFRLNLEEKRSDPEFLNDTTGLFRADIQYNVDEAFQMVEENLIAKIK